MAAETARAEPEHPPAIGLKQILIEVVVAAGWIFLAG